ncbi:MAG: bacteriohemerythrin [Pseudomonadota bacterium]
MTFWPWNKELEVGIGEIDKQHKWLVDTTNELHDAIEAGADKQQIGGILESLMDYTMNHFIVEEDLFYRLGYPETAEHKAEHDKFTGEIMELLDRHESGESAGEDTLTLLKEWLTHHILEVDKGYVEHFRAHGIT